MDSSEDGNNENPGAIKAAGQVWHTRYRGDEMQLTGRAVTHGNQRTTAKKEAQVGVTWACSKSATLTIY